MKRTYFLYTILCLSLLLMSSCEDFLDINPDSETTDKDLFSNAQGVENALNGIYSELNNESLYGQKLSWALPEVLSQDLEGPTPTSYDKLQIYKYKDAEPYISSIWKDVYKIIGYTNNIITNLEAKDANSFPLYNMYLGEAYGLRAFLHFELLRLFAPHIELGAGNEQGIPYVKKYTFDPTPFSSVATVYDAVIADLKKAQTLLVDDETHFALPRVNGNKGKEKAFLKGREMHFNYYAATGVLARTYRMKGDLENAKTESLKVINSGKFPLVTPDKILSLIAGKLSETESIFGLFSRDFLSIVKETLYSGGSYSPFKPYQSGTGGRPLVDYKDIYSKYLGNNSGSDFRLQWFRRVSSGSGISNCLKLVDVVAIEEGRDSIAYPGISLMRIPEMYYIVAEADIVAGRITEATDYINKVLVSRGLTKLEDRAPAITPDLDMLYNERHKELFCEGQRWFDMKKRNLDIPSNKQFITVPASNEVYVLPIPREEFEIRNN